MTEYVLITDPETNDWLVVRVPKGTSEGAFRDKIETETSLYSRGLVYGTTLAELRRKYPNQTNGR